MTIRYMLDSLYLVLLGAAIIRFHQNLISPSLRILAKAAAKQAPAAAQ